MSAYATSARVAVIAIGVAATMIGCNGPTGSSRALPFEGTRAAATAAPSNGEAVLDRAVVESQQRVAASATYGVIDGIWQAPPTTTPGVYLIDGDEVTGPPEDTESNSNAIVPQSVEPQAQATPNCSTFVGSIPPPCTNTGEFRRVFSAPGYSYALAHVTLPAAIPGMPGGKYPVDGDIGYVYMEGWLQSAPNAGNSEFGFQYSATNKWYAPYFRTNSPHAFGLAAYSTDNYVRYTAGQTVTLALAGYKIGTASYLHVSVLGKTVGSCPVVGGTASLTTNNCLAHGHFLDNGWSESNCCIFARMTTIAQTRADDPFYDGATFGPITWSNAELARTVPAPAPGSTLLPITGNQAAWTSAGNQSYPSGQSKVVVQNASATGETDTINLTKLPPLTVTMNPSTARFVHPPASVKYTVSLSGATGDQVKEYSITYLWGLYFPIGKDSGASLSVAASKASATLSVPNTGAGFEVWADLLFTDAAGKQVHLYEEGLDQNGGHPRGTDIILGSRKN
jgi:hypothetical protein